VAGSNKNDRVKIPEHNSKLIEGGSVMRNIFRLMRRKCTTGMFLNVFVLAVCLIMSAAGDAYSAKAPSIKASWNAKKAVLTITGSHWGKNNQVVISNAANGDFLGSAQSNKSGNCKLTLKSPSIVPCRIRAESGTNFAEMDVKKVPSVCSRDPFTNVFAFNNLGMHCYDKDFSVFAILPPFNVVNAQVVRKGAAGSLPQILDDTQAGVFYSAVADGAGSINTTSANKTNFWNYVQPLFGVSLPVDVGILGQKMPGSGNVPQAFAQFDPALKWFSAEGIPITDIDDSGKLNTYPLMRIQPFDVATVSTPPPTFTVLPVSDEMHCSNCHGTNGVAADNATKARYGISAWSTSANPELQYRENVLILHDAKRSTTLMASKPVLCASCHYSPALDLNNAGPQGKQIGNLMLSLAIHGRHGKTLNEGIPDPSNPALIPDTGITTCYNCHPGTTTQCLRGAMASAGIVCQDCHGGLLAVGGVFAGRTPWANEPKCQSCHTGDAVDHLGSSIIGTKSYNPTDPSAAPIIATNKRFAEGDNTLYRNSLGHSGIACEACHNSTHAEWPTGNPNSNDNIAAIQLQGHTGVIIECTTCHADGAPLSLNGPHGMHNVNDGNWNGNHSNFFRQSSTSCMTCHGTALEGTVLSRAATDRTLFGDDNKSVFVAKGTQISCTLCHENPLSGGGN
jgi:hypothetical protein